MSARYGAQGGTRDRTVLVFDCGTSALKAVLFSDTGTILTECEIVLPVPAVPHRQAPQGWWDAARAAIAGFDLSGLAAIGLTGTMENVLALDERGEPVADAILYPDPCGTDALEALDPQTLAGMGAICGNAPEPLMSVFKLAHFRARHPDAFARTRKILFGPKDYLGFRLTGQWATDPANASTTGLMDMMARDWSPALVERFGLAPDLLPPILPGDAVIGLVSPAAADHLGLPPGIAVINGCGDGAATTLGSGAAVAGEVSLYLGTSGWVARIAPLEDAAPRPFYRLAHPSEPGAVIEIAPILSAGAAAQWARDALGLDLATAEAEAQAVDFSPSEALFLPYLQGERSPFLDLGVRGAFLGLDAAHKGGALYYAVLEGVGFAIAANLAAMGGTGAGVNLIGGGARSALWPQVLADILKAPVTVPNHPVAASSLGAFRLVERALGLVHGSEERLERFTPRPERAARIEQLSARFAAATRFVRTLSTL